MPEYARALVFVYLAAIPALFLARRYSAPFVPRQEFTMWAGCWLATVAVVFITHNFVLFAVFLGLLSIYCHRQPFNPIYLYIVLMFCAPAIDVLAGLGANGGTLIYLNPSRLLAIFFLAPLAMRVFRETRSLTLVDKFVLLYTLIVIVLTVRLGKSTDVMRMMLTSFLDILLPYFVFSRTLTSPTDLKKVMAAFVVAVLPIAAISLIEAVKMWRLYQAVEAGWGVSMTSPYMFRSGVMRAVVSTAQPISLGFTCMTAIGCLLATRKPSFSDKTSIFAVGLISLSLFVTVSRGPWVGAVALVAVTLLMQRGVLTNLVRAGLAAVALLPILMLSPIGEKIVAVLPFIGKDTNTEDYRVKLFEASMIVIGRNPLFGDPNFLTTPEMHAMIQGEGIVDIVNTYLGTALTYGLVTMAVFCAIFVILITGLIKLSFSAQGPQWHASAILGTVVAIAITLVTVSSVNVIPYIYWMFIGLSVGILRCASLQQHPLSPESLPEPVKRMKVLGQW
ncbi:O-antigen ligase family protein [Rhizobium sp. S152]|uniref:O-antigen ligase family protein n=1 Tax=Rhizobium sp. S152 TaxID=3055038 RepID=UPI0025AA1EAE|nr:O-antigen ligase family protein [Rhizobium sp. S152]MDM9624614.1 O-antigen ligase family protein [Rhizobium sp. S152]